MIQESYVTLEQAKALKELGFPLTFIDNDINPGWPNTWYVPQEYGYYLLPTQSLVQKWLREEKNIDLYIQPVICAFDGRAYRTHIITDKDEYFVLPKQWIKYKDALSAGIDKCIELLKEKKNGK